MSGEKLPAGWRWATLDEIAAQVPAAITDGPFGSNLKSVHYTDAGPRVVRLQNIGDGQFLDARAHISDEHFASLRKHEVKAGDVLVAVLGEVLPRACLAPAALGPAIVKADCIRVRTSNHVVSPAYLMHALNCEQTRRAAAQIVHGVGRPRLSLADLRALQLPLAPRAEQDRIVATIEQHLSDIDMGVASLDRALANLRRYRASILQTACEGRLVPTEAELARREGRDYEDGATLLRRLLAKGIARPALAATPTGNTKVRRPRAMPRLDETVAAEPGVTPAEANIPEGWAWTTIGAITSTVTSGSRDWSRFYGRGTATFIMAQNVRPGLLDLSYRQAVDPPFDDRDRVRSQVDVGDLLVTIVGANTGDVCLVTRDLPEHYVCQSVALMRPILRQLSPYLLTYLASPAHGQRQYGEFIYGAGRPHLSFDQLRATTVALPPLAEQERMLAEVQRLLSVADATEHALRAQLTRANRLRRAVLQRAFEGRLVPQDPSDEPASTLPARLRAAPTAPTTPAASRSTRRKRIPAIADSE